MKKKNWVSTFDLWAKAMQKTDVEARKRFGKEYYSSRLKTVNETKAVSIVKTRDGKSHQVTVRLDR